MKHWSKRKNAGRKKGSPLDNLAEILQAAAFTVEEIRFFWERYSDIEFPPPPPSRSEEVTDLRPDEYEVVDSKSKYLSLPPSKKK